MASRNDQIRESLEILHRSNGLGGLSAQAFEMLYGINYRATGVILPANTDQVGLTFFTKTDMNLQEENITQDRSLSPMVSREPLTYPRAIRAYLDPWGAANSGYATPLVNPRQAFIAPLTNLLTSVSGWPDPVMGTHVSREGILGEQWGMADGIYEFNGQWDMSATFNNVEGNLLVSMFNNWVRYEDGVYTGRLMPYPWNNFMNRIDYVTRCYRLILDPGRQFVQNIMACGYGFPTTVPWGGIADFDSADNFATANNKITIQFRCFGAMYDDPILYFEFNQTVAKFNPDLQIANAGRLYQEDIKLKSADYYRVTAEQRDYLVGYCYPLIHPFTQELCWFIEKDVYNQIMNYYGAGRVAAQDFNVIPQTTQDVAEGYMANTLETTPGTNTGGTGL